jgi:rare lipoprotein A
MLTASAHDAPRHRGIAGRLALIALACCLSACETAGPAPGFSQVGTASWYGRPHHGRPTASGERFDMRAMTAAHRDLPFGSIARVTNLETGRSVKVRINDRGPFVDGRILDLSAAAGAALGIKEAGTAEVRIEVLGSDQPTKPRSVAQ